MSASRLSIAPLSTNPFEPPEPRKRLGWLSYFRVVGQHMFKFMSQQVLVRNLTPADRQITAEQLVREAQDGLGGGFDEFRVVKRKILDEAELREIRFQRRKDFEDRLRRNKHSMSCWVQYADYESKQQEYERARSVFERAIQIDYTNSAIWLKYCEMEQKNQFYNHARNVFERVIRLLPKHEQFWFKYAFMEEALGNYKGTREIYNRWMEMKPEPKGWLQFVEFEERCGEIDQARKLMEKMVEVHTNKDTFLTLCQFEEKHGHINRARSGFEQAVLMLGGTPEVVGVVAERRLLNFYSLAADEKHELIFNKLDEFFYIKFAQFEERNGQIDRARRVYQIGLSTLDQRLQDIQDILRRKNIDIPTNEPDDHKKVGVYLYRKYVQFEKLHGNRQIIEEIIQEKRQGKYEALLKEDPCLDTYFDYLRMEFQRKADRSKITEIFERAIKLPPDDWSRMSYIWLWFAGYLEFDCKDVNECWQIYTRVLRLLPENTCPEIWIAAAECCLRHQGLAEMRAFFGQAIEQCARLKVFCAYSDLELRIGNVVESRQVCQNMLSQFPTSHNAWLAFIDLEQVLSEHARVHALYEAGVTIEEMDEPEIFWQRYIEYETENKAAARVISLYQRLLAKTRHVKVILSYANFVRNNAESWKVLGGELAARAESRKIMEDGNEMMRLDRKGEERACLLNHWLELERQSSGDDCMAEVEKLERRQPNKIVRKQKITDEDENETWEIYVDYEFPEDSVLEKNAGLLAAKEAWKRRKLQKEADSKNETQDS